MFDLRRPDPALLSDNDLGELMTGMIAGMFADPQSPIMVKSIVRDPDSPYFVLVTTKSGLVYKTGAVLIGQEPSEEEETLDGV